MGPSDVEPEDRPIPGETRGFKTGDKNTCVVCNGDIIFYRSYWLHTKQEMNEDHPAVAKKQAELLVQPEPDPYEPEIMAGLELRRQWELDVLNKFIGNPPKNEEALRWIPDYIAALCDAMLTQRAKDHLPTQVDKN